MTANELRPTSEAARAAGARSRAYGLFAELFDYPDAGLCQAVREGAVGEALRHALASVDPTLAAGDWSALAEAGDGDELAVEYTRLFDVGSGGPPCPLYGGVYGGARMTTMEETLRFYRHFGLGLAEAPRELPDHLVTELEFLHFLTYREAECAERGEDASAFERAARDFVARHPGRFVPKLRARLAKNAPPPFYRALTERLEALLSFDQAALVARVGPVPEGAPPSSARASAAPS